MKEWGKRYLQPVAEWFGLEFPDRIVRVRTETEFIKNRKQAFIGTVAIILCVLHGFQCQILATSKASCAACAGPYTEIRS